MVPLTGADTYRLFPLLDSAPRFGRRRLPDVLETQLPADENVIEMDRLARLEGGVSTDGTELAKSSDNSSGWNPAGSAVGNKSIYSVPVPEIRRGFTRCTFCWSSVDVAILL